RSADDVGAAGNGDAASAGVLNVRGLSAAPQSAQNFLPGEFSAPHAVQRMNRRVPQSPQKFFPSGLAAPQLGHSMPDRSLGIRTAYHSLRGPPPEALEQEGQGPSLGYEGRH